MTTTRIKSPVSTIHTREEMETLLGEIAELKAKEQQITGELNETITRLRKRYEGTLGAISILIDDKTALAKDWADRNPDEFGARKSLDLTHGTVGWRIGNPTLKTMPKWTWELVLDKLKEGGFWFKYLRVKQEVNKELLLADRVDLGDALKSIGVRVVQVETFFIEPKIESTATRLQEAA